MDFTGMLHVKVFKRVSRTTP